MDLVGFVGRVLTFAGILTAVGAVTFRIFVISRASLAEDDARIVARRAAALGIAASVTLLPAAVLRLLVQVAGMRFPGDPWIPMGKTLLLQTTWGTAWIAQSAAAVFLIVVFARARVGARVAWVGAALLAAVLVVTPSVASHAMSAQRFGAFTVVADVLHIAGASAWLGTLAVLFAVTMRGDDQSRRLRPLLAAFSPVALGAAALVTISGVVSSMAHLDAWAMVFSTDYGRLLVVKVAVVGLVALFGLVNWRVLTPRGLDAATVIRRSMAAELVVALAVVLVTGALVVTPPPAEAAAMSSP